VAGFSGRRSAALTRVVVGAWLVHLYTASGALCAFLALNRIFYDRYRDAFIWLGVAVVIDATDGMLARRADVARHIPWFNGRKLDDVVDYVTYVLVPDRWSMPVVAAMLLSSAYGFGRDDAKTIDHLFTGFPSYWNIVVLYLYLAGWAPETNTVLLLVLAGLVFAPIRFVYPSRTPMWRPLTMTLGVAWAVMTFVLLWQMPEISRPLLWASLVFPVYYVLLSMRLTFWRASGRKAAR
jgi:phosphatidylcholine synthase